MFPLGTTLLPGEVLPLHVFEPRYRRLVDDLLADDDHQPEFGVTLIERGSEVGGGEVRCATGTIARVIDVHVTPDRRFAVIALGVERIRVAAWLPDDPYPRAQVEPWPDEGDPPADLAERVERLHTRIDRLNGLVRELGHQAPPPGVELGDVPGLMVNRLGVLAPIGPADRYRMLVAPGLAERMEVLGVALDDAEAALEFRLTW